MIIKMTDVETHINPRNVDIGDIGSRFYTEDENTAFIRIRINYNGSPVDLTKTDMKPKLDLFMEDGSVFTDETIEVLIPESGLIQYDIPSNVIKHIGKANCKLFMESNEHSVHVANFSFTIVDSGVEKAVAKEVNLNLVKDAVKQIMSEDLVDLLDDGFKDKLTSDLEKYLSTHNEEFKGPQGDVGPQGEQGPPGPTPTLPDFSNWQKHKLTQDDGSIMSDFSSNIDFDDVEQLKSLPNGIRYVTKTSNLPSDITSGFGWVIKLSRSDLQMFSIYFQPYNSNQIVQKTFYNNLSDWRYISGNQNYKDTGWQPLSLINGTAQAGSANQPKYRLVTINGTNMLFINGAVSNISSKTMVFAKLPTNISQKISGYTQYTKASINSYINTMTIYNITLNSNGELKITLEPNSTVDSNSVYSIEGTITL
ncbi:MULTISPECIES: BppU family phage baseplate upper protein [Staphylococcus]|uniref:BppU family phage baseplate upper protein n=1 Tax=Staphylococcus TaxID=1279 RepID=UPI0008A96EEC|nr:MULTISPECIES: BppU family phage baseplate upper protein [Staphylococcus]NCA39112.1 phage baseplate upper protein [Streptococcus equi]OHP68016.1 phage tail protein [Staphylococcus sp. HMSC062C03]